uniref:Uncharacterized protein n=1 Tax=Hucho hucho TaxID=62062 RepID=A0A4W5QZD9_9TELE
MPGHVGDRCPSHTPPPHTEVKHYFYLFLLLGCVLLNTMIPRYEECVQLMQSLEYLGNRTRISTAKGWFYAGCFDFLLYSGFAFHPFEECYIFVEESQSDPNLVADRSLMMNLWLCVSRSA